ncbi:ODA2, partial [Symbiodinium necroappetens]
HRRHHRALVQGTADVDFIGERLYRRRHCEADAHGGKEVRTDRQGLAEDHAQVGRDNECGGLLPERAATPDDASASGWIGDVSKVIGELLGRKAAEVSTLLLHFRSGPPEDSVARKRPGDHPGLLDIVECVDDFEKLFDAISRVTFDKIDRRKIKEIKSVAGSSDERVILQAPVMAQGNIEEWLQNLEAEMQRSVRRECRLAAGECGSVISSIPVQSFA